jgi:Fe-S cluster assembly ATP-binding protein
MAGNILLEVKDLQATVEGHPILNRVSLTIRQGEVHAIMGPNGSGKSTLAKVLAGHPAYKVTGGSVSFQGTDLLELEADERARTGLFLAFQYPMEIAGVTIQNFLRTAMNAIRETELPVKEFREFLFAKMDMLGMNRSFATRFVNEGFSGGEKKRNEILQLALLEPSLAVLDETDSGLDIDALKIVSHGVNKIREEREGKPAVLMITHYNRILDYIKPDHVHVLQGGKIVLSGGPELALKLEEEGYDWLADNQQRAAG